MFLVSGCFGVNWETDRNRCITLFKRTGFVKNMVDDGDKKLFGKLLGILRQNM